MIYKVASYTTLLNTHPEESEEHPEDADNPEMQGAYAQIVDAMVKQCGDSVEQVQRR